MSADGNEELNAEEFDESDDDEDILETCEVDSDSSESDYNDSELYDDANNDDFYVGKDKTKWAKWDRKKKCQS
ncbi:hypothetical protein AVEN_109164-1 [Araneus ventricosus]|uniref:Uncharacterized protein n=1 Tax=Araneus ventricosus TaxID=182803 RepID=A0A4Y2X5Q9_ARAVE|nr:hypothetical protein AVEN_109164-1 [Araneus ventricosus]